VTENCAQGWEEEGLSDFIALFPLLAVDLWCLDAASRNWQRKRDVVSLTGT
jgi:hypothetical protein